MKTESMWRRVWSWLTGAVEVAKKSIEGTRRVRVLVDCRAGKCGQWVSLSPADADALVASGEVDDTPVVEE